MEYREHRGGEPVGGGTGHVKGPTGRTKTTSLKRPWSSREFLWGRRRTGRERCRGSGSLSSTTGESGVKRETLVVQGGLVPDDTRSPVNRVGG